MHFVYEGFKQEGCRRFFSFLGVQDREPEIAFLLEVDLQLLGRYGVAVQEGPLFCQDLLAKAMLQGPGSLAKLQKYTVISEDLRPIVMEREKREADKEMKRRYRSAYRKPPVSSNVVIGNPQASNRRII